MFTVGAHCLQKALGVLLLPRRYMYMVAKDVMHNTVS